MVAGAQFQVRNSNGSVLTTVNVPSTGTYQTWQTISSQVNLPAGQQTIRIFTSASPAGWNFNWMEIIQAAESNRRSVNVLTEEISATIPGSLQVYPNPVQDVIRLQVNNDYTGKYQVQVINMNGVIVKEFTMNKNVKGIQQSNIPVGELQKGAYILKTITGKNSETKQIIKL
jgi:endoglucanase